MTLLAWAPVDEVKNSTLLVAILTYVAIWFVVCGLIPGIVATYRGRSFWGWVAIGMLTSPVIGIILLIVLQPVVKQGRFARGRGGADRYGGARGGARALGRAGGGRRSRAGRGDRLHGMGNWSAAHGEAPDESAEPAPPARTAPRSSRRGAPPPPRVPPPRRASAAPHATPHDVPPELPPPLYEASPPPAPEASPVAADGIGSYWIETKSGRKGPFSPSALRKLVDQGRIPRTISVVDAESGLRLEVGDLI